MSTGPIPVPVSKLDAELIRSWRANGLVFLVGSFISTFSPTNLPSGGQVGDALWSYLFCWPNWFREDFSYLPFEALIEHYPDPDGARLAIRDMFSTKIHNAIHKCLAEQLISGEIEGIITTNYDRCLDTCLPEYSDRVITICKDDENHKRYLATRSVPNPPRIYFKIHGTAEPGEEATLVCRLEQEAELLPWKLDLLKRMVEGRTLVILGYSGRDFDICPVLSSDAEPATVVWLQPSHQDLSPHALEVLSRKKGVWVACEKEGGRLVRHKYLVPDFLRTVINLETEAPVRDIYDAVDHVTRKPSCGGSLEDDRAEVEHVAVGKQETWKPDSYFDPRHLSNWRVQILNRVACPSLGLPLLPDFVGDAAQRFDLESSMYGHIGLYRRSIMVKKRSFKIRAQTAEERLQNRVDLASCWYIYGRPIRAWLQLWSAKCQAERYDNKKILAMIADRRLMMISRVTELIDHGPLRTIAGHLRSRYEDDERIARDQLVVSGNLDGFQSLKHN